MIDTEDILDPDCRVVLGDFGTARSMPSSGARLEAPVGTKYFWAPEFFDERYGLKVDVWALGVVIYSLLSARFPFRDEGEVRFRDPAWSKHWHPQCQAFIRTCLE